MDHFSFDTLREVMDAAVYQAEYGKGQERHGFVDRLNKRDNVPLGQQPWKTIADNVGDGFLLGQALKKIMELRAFDNKMSTAEDNRDLLGLETSFESWKRESLGAIVYIAMAIMWKQKEIEAISDKIIESKTVKEKVSCE